MKMKIRHALLGITASAALFSAIANGAPSGPTEFYKLKTASTVPAVNLPAEELISSLIVKPRARGSEKLTAALHASDARGLVKTAHVEMKVQRQMSGNAHLIKLDHPVTLSEARVIAARLVRGGDVELAEPDRIMRVASTTPSDPDYGSAGAVPSQWHYFAPAGDNKGGINLPNAWDSTLGSASINVAVIDTGYRQHVDLGTVLPGYDFITDSILTSNDGDGREADASDPGDWIATNYCGVNTARTSSWHGTHVAGTIAALMNNALGGTGIAPNVKILPVRVIGKCGGLTSDIVDGMRWAAGLPVPGVAANPSANVAHVLNLSLGGAGACSPAFQSAVTDIVNAGKVIVAATGNDGAGTVSQPANCAGVIAVTAHAIDGDNANYANVGPETAISAPGGGCGTLTSLATCRSAAPASANGQGIYSLGNTGLTSPSADNYVVKIGTSMAAPHVAGVIALMLSIRSTLTPAEVRSYLQSSARPHPASTTCTKSSYSGKCGAGLLDADEALKVAFLPKVRLTVNSTQVVAPNVPVTLSGTATATAGRAINAYAWTQIAGASVGALATSVNNNIATTTFTAPATGIYSFALSATDDATPVPRTGTVTAIVRVNSVPVLSSVTTQTVSVGNALNFTVSASDVDGDVPIIHSVSLPPGATLSAAGIFSWPSATPAGDYTVAYFASDNDASTTQGTVNITVAPSTTGSGGGGGGSLDGNTLIGLALLAICFRMRRIGSRCANR